MAKKLIAEALGKDVPVLTGVSETHRAAFEAFTEGMAAILAPEEDAILAGYDQFMADFGRIVVCGMVANYNSQNDPYPIRNLWQVLVNRITMRGFLAYEAMDMLHEAEDALADWVRHGKLVATENVSTGLETAPDAFIRLMSGQTQGKTLVRINDSVTTMDNWKAPG